MNFNIKKLKESDQINYLKDMDLFFKCKKSLNVNKVN